jgi:tRNA uridine 5-carboxymethylaminomethyl modification enzyme
LENLTGTQLSYLRRPETQLEDALFALPPLGRASRRAAQQVYLESRYAPYQAQQRAAEERLKGFDDLEIPNDLRFERIPGLSRESVQLLATRRPVRLGDCRSIPGVNQSMLAVLAAFLRRQGPTPGSNRDVSRETI